MNSKNNSYIMRIINGAIVMREKTCCFAGHSIYPIDEIGNIAKQNGVKIINVAE